jgi:hypothetical protein
VFPVEQKLRLTSCTFCSSIDGLEGEYRGSFPDVGCSWILSYEGYLSIFYSIVIVFHIVIDGRISTIDQLIYIESSERKLILVATDFFHYISVETASSVFFKVRNDSSVALEYT